MLGQIERNLFLINAKIVKACQIYEREVSKINLVAVSKTINIDKIIQAINLGCKNFGENYLSEIKEKWPEIKKNFPQIKLHFIGSLQSNKAKDVIGFCDVIESLDSKKLATVLQKETKKQNKNPEIFIQVNIGEEAQKGGVDPKEVADLVKFSREACGLNIVGLMCVPPSNELASPYFAFLTKLAKENGLKKLSMGMSSDFEEAIALGATELRLGTAIFGERIYTKVPSKLDSFNK